MLTKNPKKMDLVEIHDELAFTGIDREFTRLDDARAFLITQVKKGTVMANAAVKQDLGIQEEKQDNKKPAPKAKKEAKPKKEKPTYNFAETKWKGATVFTSGGKAIILGYDETHKRFQVQLAGGSIKDYAESAVRFKAVNDEYREKYVHDNAIRTESGSISIHTGDEISEAMLGLTEAEVRSLAKENGLEKNYDKWQEKDLNVGMRRMNVGNMLRAKLRKGEKVTIFGKTDLKEAAQLRQAQLAEERKVKEAEKEAKRKEREAKAKEKAAKKAEAKKAKAAPKKAPAKKEKK